MGQSETQRSATPNAAATAHANPLFPTGPARAPGAAAFDVPLDAALLVGDTVIVVTASFVFVFVDVVGAGGAVGGGGACVVGGGGGAALSDVELGLFVGDVDSDVDVDVDVDADVDADVESVAVAFETKMVGAADAKAPRPVSAAVGWTIVDAPTATDEKAAKSFGAGDGGALMALREGGEVRIGMHRAEGQVGEGKIVTYPTMPAVQWNGLAASCAQ